MVEDPFRPEEISEAPTSRKPYGLIHLLPGVALGLTAIVYQITDGFIGFVMVWVLMFAFIVVPLYAAGVVIVRNNEERRSILSMVWRTIVLTLANYLVTVVGLATLVVVIEIVAGVVY